MSFTHAGFCNSLCLYASGRLSTLFFLSNLQNELYLVQVITAQFLFIIFDEMWLKGGYCVVGLAAPLPVKRIKGKVGR